MSSISSISSTNTATAAGSTGLAALPSQTLDQNAFLKLLVSQIQYQDPMNPKSDTDMAAQMAQFTSLQQASESSASLAMLQASNLIGSTVTVQVDQNNSTSGVVGGVIMNNGKPQVTVNGASYSLSQITSVSPTPQPTATPQPTVSTSQN
jgi:flagellar basal-body rod modification protein FlgD